MNFKKVLLSTKIVETLGTILILQVNIEVQPIVFVNQNLMCLRKSL